MLRIDLFKVAGLLVLSSVLIACGSLSGDDEWPKSAKRIANEAVENQVFVQGGSFQLGDVGQPNGSPYMVLTDHARPAVKVKVDSYSISRYETTWGEMEVESFSILKTEVTWGEFVTFLQSVGRADDYTIKNGFTQLQRQTCTPP